MFQSAPRSEDRGESLGDGIALRFGVSIRAPIRRPGRGSYPFSLSGLRSFQSAPRSEDRGEAATRTASAACARFNPRPDPKTGARQVGRVLRTHATVSIRAPIRRPGRVADGLVSGGITASFNPRPDPKTGASWNRCSAEVQQQVSIRAPIRRPGRAAV